MHPPKLHSSTSDSTASKPPRFSNWLLNRMSRYNREFFWINDIEEEYLIKTKHIGLKKAQWWYRQQVLRSFPHYLKLSAIWSLIMFKNYTITAFRSIKRYKVYSFINILGLSIGMAACILILLWVQDELSFDRSHEHAQSLFRVNAIQNNGQVWPVISIPVGPALKDSFPEILDSTRHSPYRALFAHGENSSRERGAYVDPSFFSMFTFPFIQGKPSTSFPDYYSLVITEGLAQKYFPEENAIGKMMQVNGADEFTITGVIEDLPENSQFRFDFLIPFELFKQRDREPENWGRFQVFTYIQLRKDAASDKVGNKIAGFMGGRGLRSEPELQLQALTDLHLHAIDGGGDLKYVYIFSLIAAFILILACVNFVNLTTARGVTRAKEVGIRKVNGAHRGDLIKQFIGESLLLSTVAFVIALAISWVLLPAFNNVAGKSLSFVGALTASLIWVFLGIVFLTGLFSGSYPALFLSAFKPVNILRGITGTSTATPPSIVFRKALVIFQFTISVFLIISTLVISKQLHYFRTTDLGFEKDRILFFAMQENMNQQVESMKRELLLDPRVKQVSAISELPVDISYQHFGFDWVGKDPEQRLPFHMLSVDFDFFDTFDIELSEGRGFSREYSTDATSAYILNEAAIKEMEIESPLGKRFVRPARDGPQEGRIIGVVKDFHSKPLQEEITPLFIWISPDRYNYLCLRIEPGLSDVSGLIAHFERIWQKFSPDYPFSYNYLGEISDSFYISEERTGKVFRYFTFLAIFVSCLGLFGLAAQLTEQRTKEIGIRKILGASVPGIFKLLTKEFLVLILIANIIAWPLAWYAMFRWLQNFANRTSMAFWIFILAGTLGVLFTFLSVSHQALRSALTNPSDSLRYE
jgi:ABC-type antimicrobial peptide transport system permease subunit